ncbi:hypothetical protein ACWLMY_35450 [Streptomyces anulatus]
MSTQPRHQILDLLDDILDSTELVGLQALGQFIHPLADGLNTSSHLGRPGLSRHGTQNSCPT